MFAVTISDEAAARENFRTVLHTASHTQVVVMTLQPGEDIGAEVHLDNDQVLLFTEGTACAEVAGETREVGVGDLVVVPAGTEHNFTNSGPGVLRLVTIYAPPDHAPDTVHRTKADAEEAEVKGQDEPPSS
ncbi:MAG: cupin domain-containing protein [Sporichthyaceae bacterium]|nr:cupin domain-containing protein [Sporichthyaceae bacterium]